MTKPFTVSSVVIFLGLLFGPISPLLGQTNLTLADAVRWSLQNNQRYALAREKSKESRLRVNEAWGKLWPDLSIDASDTVLDSDSGLNAYTAGQQTVDFLKGSLTVNPGVFYNTLQATRDGHIVAVNDERRVRADTVVRAIELFDQYYLACQMVGAVSNSLGSLEENLRIVTLSYEAGSGMNLDLLRARVQTANQRTRLILMRNDRRNAAAALNNHMGLEWDAPVVIDSDALTPDDAELATLTNMSEEDIGLHIREYTAEALKNRPEVFQISAKKNAARHSALANASVYLCPTVFLNGGYQQTRSIAKSGASAPAASPAVTAIMDGLMPIFSPKGWNGSWSFTVGASYRFGGLAPWDPSWARTAQSSSQARQAEFEMEDLIRNIRVEIQQKFTRLAASAAVIPVQRENIRSAEEYFRVANIQFQNGIIDSAKLLSANVDLQNARTLYIQALFDFQNCKADLNRAIGKDLFRL